MKTMQQPALGKRIAELRKIKGLTQEELVHKCNINVRTLQRIENGVVMPRSYTIKMIFEALGSEIDLNEYMETREVIKFPSNLIAWIKNQYVEMNEWLKRNNLSMKKISMISVLALATLVFITAVSMNKGKSNSAKEDAFDSLEKNEGDGFEKMVALFNSSDYLSFNLFYFTKQNNLSE